MDLLKNERIEKANVGDVHEMINLYRMVYGKNYPIKYGTDPDLLKMAIENTEGHLVLVARDFAQNVITGAIITEIDKENRIGRLLGLVVHPQFQKNKIGNRLVIHVSDYFLEKHNEIDSLYATTRTISVGPQRIFIKNGYLPLGIFPNSHRLTQYETVSLFARYRKGFLERRQVDFAISQTALPMYNILKQFYKNLEIPKLCKDIDHTPMTSDEAPWEYEIIRAPSYVYRRFIQQFPEAKDRFFPFHKPNIIIADKEGRIEIFAYFNKKDGYCTLINATRPITEVKGGLSSLYMILDDIGVCYLELIVDASKSESIETLYNAQFVPCALYPAMREVDGHLIDYLVMSRTMEPLNFKGMAIIPQFKPYIDYYVDTWKQVNLESIEVIYDSK